jgi:hypothetical protein
MTGRSFAAGDDLRMLVREVLQEALGSARPAAATTAPPAGEAVRIAGDGDLTAFAVRIARLCDDPAARQALLAGQLRFRLEAGSRPSSVVRAEPPAVRAGRGPVTEQQVRAAAAAGARLVLGPGAVLTPLARDRARADRVEIIDERRER